MDRCPLCGSTRWRVIHPATTSTSTLEADDFRCTSSAYGEHGDIDRCEECGLVFIADDVPAENIGAAYEDVEDPEYVRGHQARVATFRRHLDAVERLEPRGRLLEIGSYTGVFLALARDSGWEVEGLEPSRWAVEKAAEIHGLRLTQGLLAENSFAPESFDAVVMWDVLEHLADPVSAVSAAAGFLKPGGLFAASTMDVESLAARLGGSRWPWYMNMHRVYFSRPTMRRVLEEAGFTDIRFVTHVRRIRVDYLAERMATRFPAVGGTLGAMSRGLGVGDRVVPFTIGDLFEVYARKGA